MGRMPSGQRTMAPIQQGVHADLAGRHQAPCTSICVQHMAYRSGLQSRHQWPPPLLAWKCRASTLRGFGCRSKAGGQPNVLPRRGQGWQTLVKRPRRSMQQRSWSAGASVRAGEAASRARHVHVPPSPTPVPAVRAASPAHPGCMGVTPGSLVKYSCSRLAPSPSAPLKMVEPPAGGRGLGVRGGQRLRAGARTAPARARSRWGTTTG